MAIDGKQTERNYRSKLQDNAECGDLKRTQQGDATGKRDNAITAPRRHMSEIETT